MVRRLIACLIAILLLIPAAVIFAQNEDIPPPLPTGPVQEEGGGTVVPPPPPPMPPSGPANPPTVPPSGPRQRPPRNPGAPGTPPGMPTQRPSGPRQSGTAGPRVNPPAQPRDVTPEQPKETLPPTPPGAGRNWTMYRGDLGHTGYTPEVLQYPLKLAWRNSQEMSQNNPSSPSVADGVAYFCTGSHLYAVNTETGSLKWKYPEEESIAGNIRTSPLIGDGLIYFGASNNSLYAITLDSGTLRWTFNPRGSISSSPMLVDGVLYFGCNDNKLYALDAQKGDMKWPGGFQTADDVTSSPAVVDGLIYFMSNDMILYAAHTATGKIKWIIRAGGTFREASPVVVENTVYIATSTAVQAFQYKSGRLKWAAGLPSEVTSVPAVANDTVYVGCRDGKLYALTTAGKLKWKIPADIGAEIHGSPIVAGDTVICGANRGTIAAVDGTTGVIKWKYTVMPALTTSGKYRYVNFFSTPVVSNGALYALADDGSLFCFRPDMADTTPPDVEAVRPSRGFLMPGTPPVELSAIITDMGSGIDPSSITMELDGQAVEHQFMAERGIVWYKTPRTTPIIPLADKRHTVSLSVADWAGNRTQVDWSFFVDNRLTFVRKKTTGTEAGASGEGAPPSGPSGEAPPPGFR